MTELLKSAFGWVSSAASSHQSHHDGADSGSSGGHGGGGFLGSDIELGGHKLRVLKLLGEGGFAYVYEAESHKDSKHYAIKRMLAHDKEKIRAIKREISIMRSVCGHQNIVSFLHAASDQDKEFLILMEFCSRPPLTEYLKHTRFTAEQVVQIMIQLNIAIRHLHTQNPPIIHRDIKVENLLVSDSCLLKLCDFGSATTDTFEPDHTWSAQKRAQVEDEFCTNTTPMYRPPEILDLYLNYPINQAVDIWALGCVLFVLCYAEHPFEDSSKLRILNTKYTIPATAAEEFRIFHKIIGVLLTLEPNRRPKIDEIVLLFNKIAEKQNIPIGKSLTFLSNLGSSATGGSDHPPRPGPPARPPPPPSSSVPQSNHPSSNHAATQQHPGELLNNLRSGTTSLFNKVKDVSQKAMDITTASIATRGVDLTYVTPKILVMPEASDVSDHTVNSVDEVRAYLDSKHNNLYHIFSLSPLKSQKFSDKATDMSWKLAKGPPPLSMLFDLCRRIVTHLKSQPDAVAVLSCPDGYETSAMVVASLMCYVRLLFYYEDAVTMFAIRRRHVNLHASHMRYIGYICGLHQGILPHRRTVMLQSVTLTAVPGINKHKNGCRPFIEVYNQEELVYSSRKDYDKIRPYTVDDSYVSFSVNHLVCGDVAIIVYHARTSWINMQGTRGAMTQHEVCSVYLHTGFIRSQDRLVTFDRAEVDLLDPEGRYPNTFAVNLEVKVSVQEKPLSEPWKEDKTDLSPDLVFDSIEQTQDACMRFRVVKPEDVELVNHTEERQEAEEHDKSFLFDGCGENFTKKHSDIWSNTNDPFSSEPIEHTADDLQQPAATESDIPMFDVDFNNKLLDFGEEESQPHADVEERSQLPASHSDDAELLNITRDESHLEGFVEAVGTPEEQLLPEFDATEDLLGEIDSVLRPPVDSQQQHQAAAINLFDNSEEDWNQQQFAALEPERPMASAPMADKKKENTAFDPFADFMNSSTPLGLGGGQVKPDTAPAKLPRGPNYDAFSSIGLDAGGSPHAPKPRKMASFSELNPFGVKDAAGGANRTIKDMVREEQLKDPETDPETLRIRDWKEGKEKNVRALLCTLEDVLWPGASERWRGCGMHQLVSHDDVRRMWRKAILVVHQDKWVGTDYEALARNVMTEINGAWEDYAIKNNLA